MENLTNEFIDSDYVYEFLWKGVTMSIHKTEPGAQKALFTHKKERMDWYSACKDCDQWYDGEGVEKPLGTNDSDWITRKTKLGD